MMWSRLASVSFLCGVLCLSAAACGSSQPHGMGAGMPGAGGGAAGTGGRAAGGGDGPASGAGGVAGTGGGAAGSGGGAAGAGGRAAGTGGAAEAGGASGAGGVSATGGTAGLGGAAGGGGTGGSAICGDAVTGVGEGCDDGNRTPFDGCSADCQLEPRCVAGTCQSRCGDGVVVAGEACDDGNTVDGDGCSARCTIEAGYECPAGVPGDKISMPIVYRDFRAHNPADFEPAATGQTLAVTGLVQPDLDANGKPVRSSVAYAYLAAATFPEWYRDTPGVNHTTAGKLPLFGNGAGTYGNRYGQNGEQWQTTRMAYFCGVVGSEQTDTATGLPIPCTDRLGSTDCDSNKAQGYKMLSCGLSGTTYTALFQTGTLDGTPLFFPVDGDTFTPASERSSATIAPPYDPNFPTEPGAPLHNFSFTSEVHFWFKSSSCVWILTAASV